MHTDTTISRNTSTAPTPTSARPPAGPDAGQARQRPLRRVAVLVAAMAALPLLATACSSGSSSPGVAQLGSAATPAATSTGSVKPSMLAYSKCMRAHGLPDFPDPNSQGEIEVHQSSGSGQADLNPNSPTYQAAQMTCQKYTTGGTSAASQSQQVAQALKYSKCMRSHGVSDFPDPTVVNGQIEFAGTGGVGREPSFASANQACQPLMTQGG